MPTDPDIQHTPPKGSGCAGTVLWYVLVYGTNHIARETFHWPVWPGQALVLAGLIIVTLVVLAGRQGAQHDQAAR